MNRAARTRNRLLAAVAFSLSLLLAGIVPGHAWTPVPVVDDPLVRMPGTQPGQVSLEDPGRCLNCHEDPAFPELPGYNWKGSMMAQAARDFLYWSCLTVAAQDAIYAAGSPNATDICLRCHMGKGWLEGRSDPTNGQAMIGSDFDGVQCDFCHRMSDPFFQTTYSGAREGSDWTGYWDEATTLSGSLALSTYNEDAVGSGIIRLFNGGSFFTNLLPPTNYVENGSGQYFVSQSADKRASFADANAKHRMFYSRYHKSKYFCSTCHDVSNPVLQNLNANPTLPLPTESVSASSYYHVERTFSEFMLSAYGRQPGGAPGIGPFAPAVFNTSNLNDYVAKCQDCHMRDVSGYGCNKAGSPLRPSAEHPKSGAPLHDLTGGNVWVSYVLASAVPGSPNYDAVNDQLLHQGPAVLTLDLTQGLGVNPAALLAGVDRAREQLQFAASIEGVSFANGTLTFRIQNQTGHKLISGFPEGRRMFVNIRAYKDGVLIQEVNPYDSTVGTLKGLGHGSSPPLGPGQTYVDTLVYEMHPSSTLTGEDETFHFVLADGRYKDNRIPPKGFDIANAAARLADPWYGGMQRLDYFSAAEYAGGYDDLSLAIAPDANYVEINLYYQTTSREYMEFLRDEIKGTGNLTLPSVAYIAQTDPFFNQLRAWGDTLWQLWTHNMNLPGAAPFLMAQATFGTPPGGGGTQCDTPTTPQGVSATALTGRKIQVNWSPVSPLTGGYNVYYDTGGKLQFIASVPAGTTTYTDTGLSRGTTYCYVVTAWNDCDGSGAFTSGTDLESASSSPPACTTAK